MERRLLRNAALYFCVSRILLFGLLIVGSQIEFLSKVHANSVWETRITLRQERVLPELIRVAMVGDAWWYRSLALDGYSPKGSETPNWAFFPLYPMTVRALGITGDFALDGMLISNLAFAAAMILLGALLVRSGFSEDDASRAMFYLAFFPTSYFLSLPVTESLFLALSLGAVLSATTERWWLAGLLGALASITRAQGVLLLLPLVLVYIERPQRHRWSFAWLALLPASLGVFMWHLHARSGDAFAFVHAQRQWGRLQQPFWAPVLQFVSHPNTISIPWNPVALNLAAAALLLVTAIVFAIKKRWPFSAYALTSLLLPLSTGSAQSMARYALVAFPLFALLACFGRSQSADRTISSVLITLFAWLVAFVVLRVDFALA